MVNNPQFGWCNFELGNFIGHPSYLTDVPVDLLDAFINYHTNGYGVAVFDEEGSHFTFIITAYNLGMFIIEEKEKPVLHNFCFDYKINDLEQELITDIENNLIGWSNFITDDDPEEIIQHRNEIRQRIAKLKKLKN